MVNYSVIVMGFSGNGAGRVCLLLTLRSRSCIFANRIPKLALKDLIHLLRAVVCYKRSCSVVLDDGCV